MLAKSGHDHSEKQMTAVALVALNEVNFELVARYGQDGLLPNLNGLMRRHGIIETTSETVYEQIEPWIQWVTVHTGLTFAEHGVFRLGDITDTQYPQIWESIERLTGRPTVAICPINARNAVGSDSLFIPDPWTPTTVTGPRFLQRIAGVLSRVVNNNSSGKITASDYLMLAVGMLRYGSPARWIEYLRLAAGSRGHGWRRAIVRDRLLTDVFIAETRKRRPAFASIFMNAAAHIQHHYMLSSSRVDGGNPDWYVPVEADPILEVYRSYDQAVADVQKRLPDYQLIIATGLHQDPCPKPVYYWRPREHARLLQLLGLLDAKVGPRMARDFVIEYADAVQVARAADRLRDIRMASGGDFFNVDQRSRSLFVEIAHEGDITDDDSLVDGFGTILVKHVKDHLSFVAIKNGIHNGIGYMIDTAESVKPASIVRSMPLAELHSRILNAVAKGTSEVGDPVPALKAIA